MRRVTRCAAVTGVRVNAGHIEPPPGRGTSAMRCVKSVVEVYALDELGPVEGTWVLCVENFGPLGANFDTHENNLFHDVASRVQKNLTRIYDSHGIADFLCTSDEFEASNPEHSDNLSGRSGGHA